MISYKLDWIRIVFLISLPSFFLGCRSNRNVEIPDAPPPYANYPAPQTFQYTQPVPEQSTDNPFAAPYNPNSTAPDRTYSENEPSRSGDNSYTLRAEGDLWALIQDPKGVELDWIKMKSGESVPLNHPGPIILTCSSGHKLKIFDKQKNPIESKSNHSGITIVKLP